MTTLVRWNPVREMLAMQNVMDRLIGEARTEARGGWSALALDIHETETAGRVA
jgi:hypothetical protein